MKVWLDYCEEYDAREQFEHKQSNWYDKACAVIKSDYCEELDLTVQERGRT